MWSRRDRFRGKEEHQGDGSPEADGRAHSPLQLVRQRSRIDVEERVETEDVSVSDGQVREHRRESDDGRGYEEECRLAPARQAKASGYGQRKREHQGDEGGGGRLHGEADRKVGARAGERVSPEGERGPR